MSEKGQRERKWRHINMTSKPDRRGRRREPLSCHPLPCLHAHDDILHRALQWRPSPSSPDLPTSRRSHLCSSTTPSRLLSRPPCVEACNVALCFLLGWQTVRSQAAVDTGVGRGRSDVRSVCVWLCEIPSLPLDSGGL